MTTRKGRPTLQPSQEETRPHRLSRCKAERRGSVGGDHKRNQKLHRKDPAPPQTMMPHRMLHDAVSQLWRLLAVEKAVTVDSED